MNRPPRELSLWVGLFSFVFGCFCLAVGVALLTDFMKSGLYGYWRTRGEVTVDATVLSVEKRTSGGGRGAPSTTVDVSYSYRVGDQGFTGHRIALFKESKGFDEPLLWARQTDTPIRVFIDPDCPHFAVIDRDFSWWPTVVALPVALVFASLGVFIFSHLVRLAMRDNASKSVAPLARNPNNNRLRAKHKSR